MPRMVSCPKCGGLAFEVSGEINCHPCGNVDRPLLKQPAAEKQVGGPPAEPSMLAEKWWLEQTSGKPSGPYSYEQIAKAVSAGKVKPQDWVSAEGWPKWKRIGEVFPRPSPRGHRPPPPIAAVSPASADFAPALSSTEPRRSQQAVLCNNGTTYVLAALLIVPFALGLVGGSVPLPIILLFAVAGSVVGWFVLRYFCDPPLENEFANTVPQAVGTFFFTAIVGLALLSAFNQLADAAAQNPSWGNGPSAVRLGFLIIKVIGYGHQHAGDTSNPIAQFFSMLAGVAICEEAIKILPVLFILRTTPESKLRLRNIVFIGGISGLGFGIVESIDYVLNAPTYGMCVFRFSSCAVGHGVYTMLSSAILFTVKQQARSKLKADQTGVAAAVGFVALVCLGSAVFHAFYNTIPFLGIFSDAALVYGLSRWTIPVGETKTSNPATIRSGKWRGTDKEVRLALGIVGGVLLGLVGLVAVVALTQQNQQQDNLSHPQSNSEYVAPEHRTQEQRAQEFLWLSGKGERPAHLGPEPQFDAQTKKRRPNPGSHNGPQVPLETD